MEQTVSTWPSGLPYLQTALICSSVFASETKVNVFGRLPLRTSEERLQRELGAGLAADLHQRESSRGEACGRSHLHDECGLLTDWLTCVWQRVQEDLYSSSRQLKSEQAEHGEPFLYDTHNNISRPGLAREQNPLVRDASEKRRYGDHTWERRQQLSLQNGETQ